MAESQLATRLANPGLSLTTPVSGMRRLPFQEGKHGPVDLRALRLVAVALGSKMRCVAFAILRDKTYHGNPSVAGVGSVRGSYPARCANRLR
jgi:hypothetical protein